MKSPGRSPNPHDSWRVSTSWWRASLAIWASRRVEGPVASCGDLPKDVQLTPIDLRAYREKIRHYSQFVEKPPLDTEALDRAIQLLYESETPAIMAGYGLALAEVFDEFHELLEKTKLPVFHTLPGKSAVHGRCDNNLGMLGMHGLYPASAASYHADFILSLGARYDDRAVGNPEVFAPKAQGRGALVHVDTEAAQFHKARDLAPNKLNVLGDAGAVVKYLLEHLDPRRIKIDPWLRQIEKWKKENTPPTSEYARGRASRCHLPSRNHQ